MPYFQGSAGRVYYRHWECAEPIAQIVFLHGYGEHSGLYHRFGDHMVAEGIDLWALDAIGHGLSEGERGRPNSITHLQANAEQLTDIAQARRPDIPTILVGHSMGAITAVAVVASDEAAYHGVVLGGMPIEALTESQRKKLPEAVMSQDNFYLDEIENDPLKFDLSEAVERISTLINAKVLDRVQNALPTIGVPLLLLCGEHDLLCPPAMLGRWAALNPRARSRVFENTYHDLINDRAHASVSAEIAATARTWALLGL